jgi:hypothetical protein
MVSGWKKFPAKVKIETNDLIEAQTWEKSSPYRFYTTTEERGNKVYTFMKDGRIYTRRRIDPLVQYANDVKKRLANRFPKSPTPLVDRYLNR